MPAWLIVLQVACGAAGGALIAAVSMMLLGRQVTALAAGASGAASAVFGLFGRLMLIAGGLIAALLWSLWCGVAYVAALEITRRLIVWRVRSRT